jgi:hypothetical protein
VDRFITGRVKLLMGANLLGLALLIGLNTPASADEGWETFCPPSATGCDCLRNAWPNPDGCYDNLGDEFRCSSNEYCLD